MSFLGPVRLGVRTFHLSVTGPRPHSAQPLLLPLPADHRGPQERPHHFYKIPINCYQRVKTPM